MFNLFINNVKELSVREERGFSLLEVIFAVFILSVGISGAISLIGSTNRLIGQAQNKTIAVNLAQEEIEVVRALRDNNWLNGLTYDTGLMGASDACLEYDSMALIDPCSVSAQKIYWSGSRYDHDSGGTETPFSRKVSISSGTDSDLVLFLRVEVVVTWNNQIITVEEHLYDWK